MKKMKLKPDAILFDMDGVLIDSLDSWWMALNSAFKAYEYKEISRDEFTDKYWGHDLNSNLDRMEMDLGVISYCNNAYVNYLDSVKIYKDTKETLLKFKEYKKAIITNTPKSCTDQILEKLKLADFFNVVMTSDQVRMGKPSPEIVFSACEKLNVDSKRCVVVGDTKSDIIAGKSAGCEVIGVRIDADYKIENLSDLEKIIEI